MPAIIMLNNVICFNLELSDRIDCVNLSESFLTHTTVPGFHRGRMFQPVEVATVSHFKKKIIKKKERRKYDVSILLV